MTQRLLAVGRRQALMPEVVDLSALVRRMSALLRTSVGVGVRVVMRLPDALPPVEVDASQLELALLNLAVNARDAMPDGGDMTIAVHEDQLRRREADGLLPDHYVVLRVTDTGVGMDEATLTQAIEPFFTTKGVGKGTGLGLSMVHGFAAQSGGRLRLRSRKGAGTVAEIWLPRAEAAATVYTQPRDAIWQSRDLSPPPTKTAHRRTVDDDLFVLTSWPNNFTGVWPRLAVLLVAGWANLYGPIVANRLWTSSPGRDFPGAQWRRCGPKKPAVHLKIPTGG